MYTFLQGPQRYIDHSAMGASQFGSDVVPRQGCAIKSTAVDLPSGEKQT
jgi:hypothetical protein